MHKNTSITLGSHFDEFITQQIVEGRYNSVSEAIRAGLRLLEDHETKLANLRQSLSEGEKSGKAKYSLEGFKKELNARKK
jgi:antitoxin ParD1/3/4